MDVTQHTNHENHRLACDFIEHNHDFHDPLISHLPDDLLLNIFQLAAITSFTQVLRFSLHTKSDARILVSILSVCRRWHTVISNSAVVWSRLNSEDWKLVPALLYRSKKAPLTVQWGILYQSLNNAEDKSSASGSLVAILKQFSRIQNLHLEAEAGVYSTIGAFIPYASPVLERLTIQLRPESARAPLNLVQAERLVVLHVHRQIKLDFERCTFPQLRDLFVQFRYEEPFLADIVAFLSRSPCLQKIDFVSFDDEDDTSAAPALDDANQNINLPELASFRCVVHSPASALLRVSRHIRFPTEIRVELGMYRPPWATAAEATNLFASIRPFPPNDVPVDKLALVASRAEIYVGVGSEDRSIWWKFYSDNRQCRNLARRSIGLTALHQQTCRLASIRTLYCGAILLSSTWTSMFAPCIHLETLVLRLDGFGEFLASFDPESDFGSNDSDEGVFAISTVPFPALKAIEIEEGGIDRTERWTRILSAFLRVLELRASRGHTLDSFVIDRDSKWAVDDETQKYLPSQGWQMEYALYWDRICQLVKTVDIIKPRSSKLEQLEAGE